MKQIALIVFLGIFLASCGDEYTEVTEVVGPNYFYNQFSVTTNMWEQDSDITGNYYYYEKKEPRLTETVLNSAIMNTYYFYTIEGVNGVRYVPLSYSDFWVEREEYFTVEYSVGFITIIYKATDATDEPPAFDQYVFEARFMW